MSTDDPYLPPATELREEQPPRQFGRILIGCVVAYLSAAALLLALEPTHNLNMASQAQAILSGLGVGALLMQFRQMSWSLLAVVAPATASVVVFVLGVAAGFFGI